VTEVEFGAASREPAIVERVESGVAVLTMSRPGRKNAFDHRMWGDLRDALERTLADESVRVVVLTGAGGDFTAGADLALMDEPGGGDEVRDDRGEHPFATVMAILTGCFDKPLVAAVDGVAVGFGLTVLLHCDFVYVSDRARLRAPFVRLGVVPEAGASYLLPTLIGFRKTAELLYTADWITGQRAVELGIAHQCLTADALLPTALATAARVAEHPPQAVRATKRLLLETRRDQVRAALARESAAFTERVGTPENVEAIRAFYEKRKPDFAKLARS
jgi:enoyl-CoA hydratase/carnithine racemase